MGKDAIFESDSSDSEGFKIKTNNEYAKNYDNWRKKEELNKLKTKYGDIPLNPDEEQISGSSSSEDDDEEAVKITEETEKRFFKTLSFLKNKDPKIYDSNVNFFHEDENTSEKPKSKGRKEAPVTIKDYERKIILGGGEFDETQDESATGDTETSSKKFSVLNDDDSDDELFTPRKKSQEEIDQEESDYKKWLAGQVDSTKDKEAASDLKPLKEYWNDPKLAADEKFLKDYILNKRYLSKEDEDYIPTYDEIVHDSDEGLSGDEEAIDNQEEFEYKFNFRFEEPDQEFIKRYPRTIEKSLRKTDDRRKVKRAETKERKQKEKEEKMAEIKKLQELKRKEIEEKIKKIKEVTGDTDMKFQDDDIEGDFDPDAHDRRMQQLFDEEFYEKPEDEQKPEFSDIDKELEIEKWDDWEVDESTGLNNTNDNQSKGELHCEDESFIMDADYEPNTTKSSTEKTKRNRKGRRKSKVAQALEAPKPKYNPNDKNCEKYFDEYYKLDCEDIIGDIPCRFKYREVVPNDFGLSFEEILLAKDRELNRWCSLKKAVQYRPDHVEKYEKIVYSQKAKNVNLKKKILPSLFEEENDEGSDTKHNVNQNVETETEQQNTEKSDQQSAKTLEKTEVRKKNKKNKKVKSESATQSIDNANESIKNISGSTLRKTEIKTTKKRKFSESDGAPHHKKIKIDTCEDLKTEHKVENIIKKKKKKDKKKKKQQANPQDSNKNSNLQVGSKKTKKIKRKVNLNNSDRKDSKLGEQNGNNKSKKKKNLKEKRDKQKNVDIGISDARLAAYGINPKKYKNKLKYGKAQNTSS